MPYYHANGLKLFYEDQGAGEPLILLHGFGQDWTAWLDPLPIYARFFRTLALDMRGGGRSDVPEPGYGPRQIAGDVIALMDHLELKTAHFAGFSLGGAVGQELAIAHPGRLSSLSLHSTWEGGPCPHMDRWVDIRSRVIAGGDAVLNAETRVVSFFSPEFVNAHPEAVKAFSDRAATNAHPITPKGAAGHALACKNHDARGRLGGITTPTLITVGSMDRSTLPEQARSLHRQIPGAELIFFDGAGHFTPYQCRDEFNSVSLGFLMKHQGGAAPAAQ
jgi:pimeloyl-ACP methyl ester carboxylesterase